MTIDPQQIRMSDYHYELPDHRIAKYPLAERDHSKLLVYRGGAISETLFTELPSLLPKGSLLVFNNTKVIQARLLFRKPTGSLIEVFCLEPADPADYAQNFQQTSHAAWYCMIGNLKRWRQGQLLQRQMEVKGTVVCLTAERGAAHGDSHRVDFRWDNPAVSFADLLEAFGELPIPPYLHRPTEQRDKESYQTVYSKREGSVAAPTAGLHFTTRVLEQLRAEGFDMEELTLHVGAGTFRPVKSEAIADHAMHHEYIRVPRQLIVRLLAHGGGAVAVGTTSVRTLESLYHLGVMLLRRPDAAPGELHVDQWQPYAEEALPEVSTVQALQAILDYLDRHRLEALHTDTRIIIVPGYRFRVVEGMVTNFHQPQSTLLLLVSAFVGEDWRRIYDYALARDFRFLSYGDSSLLLPA
ncbi:MAG: S-adenosylmethionine:tRNA ribosyltransferase-isomerase [Prevotellaceae bacterium]|jgi:S-adenosylmethionine:tRNA ribosyltransferase-isomerase|nr:S-adenosylmethionine:tRNA ribosyltransferase-isomerase [Prevotellaceae bacterium]